MLRLKATLGREQWQYCMTPTWPVLEVDYGHKAYSFLDMDSTLTFLSCAALASYLLVKNRTKAPSRGKSEKAKRNNIKGLEKKVLDGSGYKIGILKARWNADITNSLASGCRNALYECGVKKENIIELEVPGSYELVAATKKLLEAGAVDGVVPIGCLIKGETMHFEYICESVSSGLMQLNLGYPKHVVLFGVLTCLTEKQAIVRSGLSKGGHNHGSDWGFGVVEMLNFQDSLGAIKTR